MPAALARDRLRRRRRDRRRRRGRGRSTSRPERRVADRPAGDPGSAPRRRARAGRAATSGGRCEVPREAHARHPGHPRRDPAGDLVVDRAEPRRDLLGEDRVLALGADQHGLVAGLDLGLRAEVDGHVVHRDGADERVAATADQHLGVVGEAAAHAVAVAERQHPDPGVLRRPPGLAVAGAVARPRSASRRRRRSAATAPAPGLARPDRPGTGRGRRRRRRSAPCRSASARSRKTAALLAAWAVTPGNSALTAARDLGEAVELLVEEVGVRFVGGGEMGPDPGQLEVGVLGAGAGKRQHLVGIASCRAGPCRCRA